MPHQDIGFPEKLAEMEARLASWPVPGLAPVGTTWLGKLSATTMFGAAEVIRPNGTVTRPFAGSSLTLGDMVDAYLYLGPSAAYTWSEPNLTPVDDEDRAEVERRAGLLGEPM